MVVKELDPFPSTADPLLRAGRRAEEQMAFYLRRALADSANLSVYNGLRIVDSGGDCAQIDHLVLHRHGMIIVESKSVTTEVRVNAEGEWSRWWGGRARGMASPILQARRQGEFLLRYLEAHRDALLGKFLGVLPVSFDKMPVDVVVAISDGGTIRRPRTGAFPEVMKADQVPDQVRALFSKRRGEAGNLLNFNVNSGYALSKGDLTRLIPFLQEHHRPAQASSSNSIRETAPTYDLGPNAPPAQSSEPAPPEPVPLLSPIVPAIPEPLANAPAPSCRQCRSERVTVEYGRYGYYLKCGECGGNTPITAICAGCGGKERIRKDGKQFFAECAVCKTSRLYHKNP